MSQTTETNMNELEQLFQLSLDMFEETGTIIVSGENATLTVKNNTLVIKHGVLYDGHEVPVLKFEKGDSRLKAVINLTSSGYISLDALYWLIDQHIPLHLFKLTQESNAMLVSIDKHHFLYFNSMYAKKQSSLTDEERLHYARYIIVSKISEQLCTLIAMCDKASQAERSLKKLLLECANVPSLADLLQIEAQASSIYWRKMKTLRLNWVRSDRERIPETWLYVGDRASPLSPTNNAQYAVHPYHSLLNYIVSCTINSLFVHTLLFRLNPSIGVFRSDNDGQLSLLYDLIEPIRPIIERTLYEAIQDVPLRKPYFHTLRDGQLFIHPSMLSPIIQSVKPRHETIATLVKNFRRSLMSVT